ncbi:hypothetical protein OAJ02_02330 [Nitrosopumilus sp.]|nr:hypothetical protein [Nitrosopumilus sp.]
MAKQFRDFESARKFVRKLGFKNTYEWQEYCKSDNKPNDIPSNPQKNYSDQGWINWTDWLDSNTFAKSNRNYVSFIEAKKIVREFKIISETDWRKFCISGKRPDDLPSKPERVYKKEWTSWGDFLSTGYIANQKRNYLPFDKASKISKIIASKYKIKTQKDWYNFIRNNKIIMENEFPKIPHNPQTTYKKDWLKNGGWGGFLGTGTVASQFKKYRPFKEAREFVRSLELKTGREWEEYCKSGNKPDDIPSVPSKVYKEWKNK